MYRPHKQYTTALKNVILTQHNNHETKKTLSLLKSHYTQALNKLDDWQDQVGDIEAKFGLTVETCWTCEDFDHQATPG